MFFQIDPEAVPAMMKRVNHRLLFVALLCVLSACVQSSGRYGVDVEVPTAFVSRSGASVGEAVKVTLRGSVRLDKGSELTSESFSSVKLGACFVEGNPNISRGGFCAGEDTPLHPWVVVSADDTHVKDLGGVRVARGDTYPLELTFSFIVTEAKEVTISPWVYVTGSVGSGARGGIPVRVAFE